MQTFKHKLLKVSLCCTEQYIPCKCTIYCRLTLAEGLYKSMFENQISNTLAFIHLSLLFGLFIYLFFYLMTVQHKTRSHIKEKRGFPISASCHYYVDI